MKKVFIRDLKHGRHIETDFLVQSKTLKVARNGSTYLDLQLQDSSGVIPAKVWEVDDGALDFGVDEVVHVSAGVEDYQGSLQLRVDRISKCADREFDLRDFLPSSSRDLDEMYAALLGRLRRVPEGPLRALVLAVAEDPGIAEKFKLAPAATSYHHAYLGGLLEHVLSLVELGDQVADHYPSLDRDLVLTGLVLHDLGKIEELTFTRGFRYSTRGQLVGHMTIALEIVREKIRGIPEFPAGLRDRIEHIILSHHGRAEFGSPKEPMFPEALVVHYLDDLDSKLASMRAQYTADKDRAGDWTNRNRALGRELLKKGVVNQQ
jgi:3'-5' exoribonuclease